MTGPTRLSPCLDGRQAWKATSIRPADSSRGPHFAHHLHRRQLAKRVQLVEGALAALDHPWNDIVAPVTDGDLEHVEDLCRCEHRRPLPADQDEDARPQLPSDTVQQRILEGVPHEGGEIS